MSGFEKQTYTQVPNSLFEIMGEMDESELKVVLYVCRYTFGYHRNTVKISTRKIAEAVKMSVNSVQRGAEAAEKRGLIERINDGQNTTEWRAIVEGVSTIDTASAEVYQPLIQGVSTIEAQVRLNKDKEIIKKANKTVDAILETERKAKGKQYTQLPEIFIPYAKSFADATGIQPSKRDLMEWLSVIQDWMNAGYQPSDVTEAVRDIIAEGKISIARPASITFKLRSLAMAKRAEPHYYQPGPIVETGPAVPPPHRVIV